MISSWNIATPESTGEIKTKKAADKVLNWSYEKGAIDLNKSMSKKEKIRIYSALKFLNKYRRVRAEVLIEELSSGFSLREFLEVT